MAPEHFTFLLQRPVLEVRPAIEAHLLLFVGHWTVLAWGHEGRAWESEKLSDEGITVTAIDGWTLHGKGWTLMTDKETPFVLDLRTGAAPELIFPLPAHRQPPKVSFYDACQP